jgi:hypothetical protein
MSARSVRYAVLGTSKAFHYREVLLLTTTDEQEARTKYRELRGRNKHLEMFIRRYVSTNGKLIKRETITEVI